jgi:aminocarboxymuconate-semialdehyde decarboxylase
MITDIHCHYIPEAFFAFCQQHAEFGVKIEGRDEDVLNLDIRGMRFLLNKTFFDLQLQVRRMERLGVDRTILSLATPFIDYHLDEGLATEAARTFNDALARAIKNDDRFGAWAFLPMQDPPAAAEELVRCVKEYGFIGGHIASNVRGVYLHDERFVPVYKAAVDLGVPLFVHPADPLGKDRTREYELTIVAGYLFDNTVNILKLICSGFLDNWKTLKLVFAHSGAFSLVLRGRMQREIDTNEQLQSVLKAPVGDYLRRLYFDTICFEPAILRYVADVVAPGHLLMGSDAPFPLGEPDPVRFVRESLTAAQADAILNCNFDRLIAN